MKVEEIMEEAAKLPEKQRASIASQLLNSLESTHHWVSDQEVERRVAEAETDPSVMLTMEEFTKGVRRSGS